MSEMRAFPSRRVPADTLALRLVAMRHELGYSQRKASEESGVPFGTWQGMEAGRKTRGLDEHIQKIATTLGYDRDWLMWGRTPEPNGPDGGGPTAGVTVAEPTFDRWLVAA